MKKELIGIFICMLLIGSVLTVSGKETNSEIPISSIFGKTLYVGGDGPGNYTTIQDAINDASDGDTVYVFRGVYYENVVVDKSINLIGENKEVTSIDGGRKDDVIQIKADSVKISGFIIQYSSSHTEDGSGVKIDNSDNCIFTDCKVSHNGRYGVMIWNSYNCCILGNTIQNAGTGIHVEFEGYSKDFYQCVIKDNIIKDTTWGIYIVRNRDVVKVLNNIIVDNWWSAVNTWNIFNSIVIRGNIISRNRVGVENSGHPQFRTHYITISENVISSNSLYGVLIRYSGHSVIYKNNFENNSANAFFELDNLRYFGTNKWYFLLKGNYWDDWANSGPKIIYGKLLLSLGNFWSKEFSWKNYDLFPASKPYHIEI